MIQCIKTTLKGSQSEHKRKQIDIIVGVIKMNEIDDIIDQKKKDWIDEFFGNYFKDGYGTDITSPKNS